MPTYSLEWFWDQVYARTGLSPKDVPPRVVSHLLDQAQRRIVRKLGSKRLSHLVRMYEYSADSTQDYYTLDDAGFAKVDLQGEFGLFYYVSSEHYNYIESGEILGRELRAVEEVLCGPTTNPGGVDPAESITLHRCTYISPEEAASLISGDNAGSYYAEQYGEGMRWTRIGDYLYIFPGSWLGATTPTGYNLKLIVSLYPERFLDHNGGLKTSWANETRECELPGEFWPEMVDLAAAELIAARSGASGMQLLLQKDIQEGDEADKVAEERTRE